MVFTQGINYVSASGVSSSTQVGEQPPRYIRRIKTLSLFPYSENTKLKQDSFGSKTLGLMYYQLHKTDLLRIAQSYLGNIIEVTPSEYNKMGLLERQNTQSIVIGNYGTIDEAWCAHTVSFMCEQAGIDIGGHKKAVSQFINWGKSKDIYKPIQTNTIVPVNFIQERKNRETQIRKQIREMKEGDLIIWKSDTVSITQNGFHMGKASHIGIFEGINPDGSISVLEGNANELKTGIYERYIATTPEEARKGNQKIGEPQEINVRDGFIRKTYTAEQLAMGGYSGYIDMQNLVK